MLLTSANKTDQQMVHVSGRSSTSGPSIQRIVNLEEGVGNDAA